MTISVLGKNYTIDGIEEKCARLKWIIELKKNKYSIDLTDTTLIDENQRNDNLVQGYLL